MGISAKVGQFLTKASTGTQAITGVGFTPKLVFLWGVTRNGTGQGGNVQAFFAAAIAGAAWAVTGSLEDGQTTTATHGNLDSASGNTAVGITSLTTNVEVVRAGMTSLDSDGFTLNYSLSDGNQYTVNYLALGGTDITNVAVGTYGLPTATGNTAKTGIGFQPSAGVFACPGGATTAVNSFAGATVGIGVAQDSTHRGSLSFASQGAHVGTVDQTTITTAKCLEVISSTGTSISMSCDFVSWDADGWTLNKTAGGAATIVGYCVWKGPQIAVGSVASHTGTGNFSVTGLGFQPAALLLFAKGGATASESVGTSDLTAGIGAASSSTARGSIWLGEKNGLTTSAAQQRQDATRVMMRYDPASPFAVIGDVDFVSFDSGGFTLNQTTADSAATLLLYLAIGPAPSGGALTPSAIPQVVLGVDTTPAVDLGAGTEQLTLGENPVSTGTFSLNRSPLPLCRDPKIRVRREF